VVGQHGAIESREAEGPRARVPVLKELEDGGLGRYGVVVRLYACLLFDEFDIAVGFCVSFTRQ
jgi:hypothetical protein